MDAVKKNHRQMNEHQTNVIQFPERKLQVEKTPFSQSENPMDPSSVSFDSMNSQPPHIFMNRQKSMVAKISLLAVILGSGLGNYQVLSGMKRNEESGFSSGNRSLASVGSGLESHEFADRVLQPQDRNEIWENKISLELAQLNRQDLIMAQMGTQPNAEERLRFHTLQSQYAVIFHQGLLSEIRLPQNKEGAIDLGDTEQFLKSHMEILPKGLKQILPGRKEKTSSGVSWETYTLVDRRQNKLGEVKVSKDDHGYLLSLKIDL